MQEFPSIRNVLVGLIMMATMRNFCSDANDDLPDDMPCFFRGKVYESGQKIPQEESCHVCLCFRGRVECSWMDCPPPPEGCEEMSLAGECNPTLYVCPIPKELNYEASAWIRRLKRSSDVKPGDLLPQNQNADCRVLGVPYKTGDLMGVATHPCLECRCARDELYCSPRCCFSPLGLNERPSSIMKALSRGSRLPQKHPLNHLKKEIGLALDY